LTGVEVIMRRGFGPDIPRTLEDACDPAKMAVIVYDMQVGVLRQLPDGGAEAIQRVSQVVAAAREGGYPVIFSRHMSLPTKLLGTSQLRTAMRWQQVDDPQNVESWLRFSGDALLTDIATIAPRLAAHPPAEAGP
jgi:biuret amidohydrolase